MKVNPIGWFMAVLFIGGGVMFTVLKPEIYLGQIWIVVGVFLLVMFMGIGRQGKRAERLRTEGVTGRGEILEMTQTGMYVNEQPRVKLRLRVSGPGIETFEDEGTYTVPMIALGQLSGGRPLTVLLDPAAPERFVIDWGVSGAGVAETAPAAAIEEKTAAERLTELEGLREKGLVTETEFAAQKARIIGSI